MSITVFCTSININKIEFEYFVLHCLIMVQGIFYCSGDPQDSTEIEFLYQNNSRGNVLPWNILYSLDPQKNL